MVSANRHLQSSSCHQRKKRQTADTVYYTNDLCRTIELPYPITLVSIVLAAEGVGAEAAPLGRRKLPPPEAARTIGEVLHCYCNLPECITTGYMCKTTTTESDASGSGGGCFSDLVPFMDVDRAVHGCLDLLPEERRTECRNVPISKQSRAGVGSLANTGKRKDTREAGSPDSGANMDGREDTKEDVPDPTRTANLLPPSLLLCCNQDMCNHVDSPETRNKYNQTILAVGAVVIGSGPAGEGIEWHKPPGTSDKNSGHESGGVSTLAWLKMATVLVSICGLLVLLALVLLAIRILKSESHHATHIATLDKFT
ncbi:hypothetical protein AAG570_009623 [Ranatra chinensis]|uniref:BMP and activin membrane-bound inhibitor N-terminal domain-containing protein n=1 Tax=Ranatra chinensis TaxID=642074 RepID=A0ABD0YPM0_9HEMI